MSTAFSLTAQSFTGSGDRFQQNLQALHVLADIEREQRPATDHDKVILAHFTSFGESSLITRLVNRPDQVHDLLSADDIAGLRRAALTAFYTPLPVGRVLWDALSQLGFRNLDTFRMLEPAAGVGNIISTMPADLRATAAITAVELEPLSARILQHIHPDVACFTGGFQDAAFADSSFDLIVSNVPFGDFPVADQSIPERFLKSRIHDYFFANAMRLVRPGGIVAFLTSYGTLDKQDERVRQWLADRAELLAAYRLPCGIFAQNAGSQAGTDLLILRRYLPDEQPRAAAWLGLESIDLPAAPHGTHATTGSRYGDEADPVRVNTYFAQNPEQVIGAAAEVRRNGFLFYVVQPPAGDLADALQQRMTVTLPSGVVQPFQVLAPTVRAPRPMSLQEMADADPDLAAVSASQRPRATSLAAVYTAAKDLIRKEIDPATPDTTLDAAREELNTVYDAFVAGYGILSAPDTRRLFRHLPEMVFLLALEVDARRHGSTWQAQKAPIFTRRTLRAATPDVDGHCTVQDALIRSLDRTGQVDLPLICRLSGQHPDAVGHDLQDVIFRVPDLSVERYETADAYLSGNVRAKLRAARAVAALNPTYQINVEALERVQPDPLGADAIIVRLGAVWVPEDVIHAFLAHLMPSFGPLDGVRFFAHDASWRISVGGPASRSMENTSRWGTARRSAIDLVQLLLNSSPIIVTDVVEDGNSTRTVVNDTETAAAQEKAQAIRVAFATWIWADDARRDRLVSAYNDRFNAIRPRHYDGQHLSLPGMNTAVLTGGDLAESQKGAVWQILQNRAALLAHCVGAGKTFVMAAAAREARRMGLANKPVLVVPNHLVGQTAREALRLFPSLKLLALGSEDFRKDRRGVVLSRIATGDWDLVIIAMTSLQFLPVDTSVLTQFHTLERSRLRDAMESAQADMDCASDRGEQRKAKRGIKKIEKALERLDARIQGALQRMHRDSARTITWRELGIDMLMIDEVHNYKNLYVPSRLHVAGAPQADSLRALDLRIKTWDLLQQGHKVVFATATPIMNSLAEAFVMQLYLQEAELREQGLDTFDAWVSVYAEVRDMFEMKPDASGFQIKSRLNTFINLPELSQLWRTVMNVRTAEQLQLPRPALVGHGPIVVSVPQSRAQQRLIEQFAFRVDMIKRGAVDPRDDNMLKITSEGRLAALDQRLIIGGAETPCSKINALVARVAAIHHAYDAARGTQLIFCDLATPNGKASATDDQNSASATDDQDSAAPTEDAAEASLNNRVYHEIRAKLARQGIPPEQVAFIHDYATKTKRDELFAAVNAGTIRVLIGSTSKMGTGMNVQRRVIALHHLDAPWRPGDVEQRDGRILRQGNLWKQVYIFHYVTEGSFDGYIWVRRDALLLIV